MDRSTSSQSPTIAHSGDAEPVTTPEPTQPPASVPSTSTSNDDTLQAGSPPHANPAQENEPQLTASPATIPSIPLNTVPSSSFSFTFSSPIRPVPKISGRRRRTHRAGTDAVASSTTTNNAATSNATNDASVTTLGRVEPSLPDADSEQTNGTSVPSPPHPDSLPATTQNNSPSAPHDAAAPVDHSTVDAPPSASASTSSSSSSSASPAQPLTLTPARVTQLQRQLDAFSEFTGNTELKDIITAVLSGRTIRITEDALQANATTTGVQEVGNDADRSASSAQDQAPSGSDTSAIPYPHEPLDPSGDQPAPSGAPHGSELNSEQNKSGEGSTQGPTQAIAPRRALPDTGSDVAGQSGDAAKVSEKRMGKRKARDDNDDIEVSKKSRKSRAQSEATFNRPAFEKKKEEIRDGKAGPNKKDPNNKKLVVEPFQPIRCRLLPIRGRDADEHGLCGELFDDGFELVNHMHLPTLAVGCERPGHGICKGKTGKWIEGVSVKGCTWGGNKVQCQKGKNLIDGNLVRHIATEHCNVHREQYGFLSTSMANRDGTSSRPRNRSPIDLTTQPQPHQPPPATPQRSTVLNDSSAANTPSTGMGVGAAHETDVASSTNASNTRVQTPDENLVPPPPPTSSSSQEQFFMFGSGMQAPSTSNLTPQSGPSTIDPGSAVNYIPATNLTSEDIQHGDGSWVNYADPRLWQYPSQPFGQADQNALAPFSMNDPSMNGSSIPPQHNVADSYEFSSGVNIFGGDNLGWDATLALAASEYGYTGNSGAGLSAIGSAQFASGSGADSWDYGNYGSSSFNGEFQAQGSTNAIAGPSNHTSSTNTPDLGDVEDEELWGSFKLHDA